MPPGYHWVTPPVESTTAHAARIRYKSPVYRQTHFSAHTRRLVAPATSTLPSEPTVVAVAGAVIAAAALIFVGLLIVITLLSIPVWDDPVTEGLGVYAGTWYSGGWLFEALGFLIGADVYDATDPATRVPRTWRSAATRWPTGSTASA